jgi:hypothetical protein
MSLSKRKLETSFTPLFVLQARIAYVSQLMASVTREVVRESLILSIRMEGSIEPKI